MKQNLMFLLVFISFLGLGSQVHAKSLCYFAYTGTSCASHEKMRDALRLCKYDHIKKCIGKNFTIAKDVCYQDHYFPPDNVSQKEYRKEMENCKEAGIIK